jgi:hypothetical protein
LDPNRRGGNDLGSLLRAQKPPTDFVEVSFDLRSTSAAKLPLAHGKSHRMITMDYAAIPIPFFMSIFTSPPLKLALNQ